MHIEWFLYMSYQLSSKASRTGLDGAHFNIGRFKSCCVAIVQTRKYGRPRLDQQTREETGVNLVQEL